MYKYKNGKEMQYYIYMNFGYLTHLFKKNGETCNKAVMRFPKVQRGLMFVSHNKLDVCSSLVLINERHANMADLVKLR